MTVLAERLLRKYFAGEPHPYRIFEDEVERSLRPGDTLLDAGCGRGAPVLMKFSGRAKQLIGVDVVDFETGLSGVRLLKNDLGRMEVESGSVDVVMSRSVMEHVAEPARVYGEVHRVLKPGGRFIFLTPNLWDYASIVARCVPNRFHPYIVSKTEGRAEQDVFPICYKTNTRRAVRRWARESGFDVVSFRYLGQYPSYFMFNGLLFLVATGYEKLISRFDALDFLRGWIFVVLAKTPSSAIERAAAPAPR